MLNRTKKEPALIYGIVAAVFALLAAYGVGEDKIKLWEALALAAIPLVQGYLTRREVMPVETINQAGLTSAQVHEWANDPEIEPVREDDDPLSDYTV